MTRTTQQYAGVRSFAAILILLAFLFASLPMVAHAGDQDGLGGYSMQLKRKYFDGSGGGSGGGGFVIYPEVKPGAEQSHPELVAMQSANVQWVVAFTRYTELFLFWMR